MAEAGVYPEFFIQAVEDRDASIKEGRYVPKDEEWVRILVAGGRDMAERPATKRDKERFAEAYKAFKEGLEAPVNGYDIRMWPPISPAQAQNCVTQNIRSVEDLANLPEEGLRRLGMGSRALQQKAQAWLAEASSTGKAAEQVSALQTENETLKSEMEEMRAALADMQAEMAANKKRPQRKTA